MFNHIAAQILAEYPNIGHIYVERQFQAGLDRPSNTYLVSTNGGAQRFVAKTHSMTSQISKLSSEWWALRTLVNQLPGIAPTLLFPDHEPRDYILIDYLDGMTAEEALKASTDPKKVFELIGQTLAKLHSVTLDTFGTPETPVHDWIYYVQHKLAERFAGSSKLISPAMIESTHGLIIELLPALESERNQPPVMLHRDVYTSNVLLSQNLDHATLIDFAMATGGRPFFDFGKLLIDEPTRPAVADKAFLKGYGMNEASLVKNRDLIQLYTLLELLGQIPYFERTNHPKERDRVIAKLDHFVNADRSIGN